MRTWSNGKDFRAGKQQGEETAAKIRWQRNGGKDTATQIQRHRYSDTDTATQIQRHRYSGTDTAAQKKASQPYRISGGAAMHDVGVL